MTGSLSYKVYFMGGALTPREHGAHYDRYKSLLQKLVPAQAGRFPIRFRAIEYCSRQNFVETLTNPSTVGIVWYGHANPAGLPLTSEGHNARDKTLNPIVLARELARSGQRVSANLQFLALITCHSQKYRNEWREMLPSATKLKTFEGKVISTGGEFPGHVTQWITKSGVTPEGGARNILRYARARLLSLQPVPSPVPMTASSRSSRPPGRSWYWHHGSGGKIQVRQGTQKQASGIASGIQGIPWYWQRGSGGKAQIRQGTYKQRGIITPMRPATGLRKRGPTSGNYINQSGITGRTSHIGAATAMRKSSPTSDAFAKRRKGTAQAEWLRKQIALANARQKRSVSQFRRRWVKPTKTMPLRPGDREFRSSHPPPRHILGPRKLKTGAVGHSSSRKRSIPPRTQGIPWYWQRGPDGKFHIRQGTQRQDRYGAAPKP